MAKVAFRGFIFASFCMVAAACGGDDGGSGLVFVDAAASDGGGGATCNPVSQMGCAEGEKCASVTVQESPTFIVQTLCVPDGDKAEGEACTTGAAGPTTGYDNCTAFNECIFGECRPVCRQQGSTVAGTCEGAAVCQIFNSLFEDLDTDDVGICIPQCNPTAGITLVDGSPVIDYSAECGTLQCFMNLFDGIGICAGSFDMAPGHNESCGDSCALNGCAPGNGPLLPGGSLSDWKEETVFFANTIFGLADTCIQYCDPTQWEDVPGCDLGGGECAAGDFQANCPAANECRIITGLYINFDNPTFAPETFGLCLPNAQDWGSCKDHNIDDIAAYLTEEGQEPVPVPAENDFIPGCSAGQAVFDKIDELSMMSVAPSVKKEIIKRATAAKKMPLPVLPPQ